MLWEKFVKNVKGKRKSHKSAFPEATTENVGQAEAIIDTPIEHSHLGLLNSWNFISTILLHWFEKNLSFFSCYENTFKYFRNMGKILKQ